MTFTELALLEGQIEHEVKRRQNLGGYSTDADSILMITQTLHKLIQHLMEEFPKEKLPKMKVSK